MRSSHGHFARALLVGGLLLASVETVSCKSESPTAMVVAISSEAPVPKGIDGFTVTVTRGGATVFEQDYVVGADGSSFLPGTLTLHPEDDNTDEVIHVKVLAKVKKDPFPMVLREATLGFSKGQQKLLRMPLRYACIGVTCDPGMTCHAGMCEKDSVDPETLPVFANEQVFPVTGKCFARPSCIEGQRAVLTIDELRAEMDPVTCTIPHDPTAQDVNMGFVWSYGFSTECTLVDFDGSEGWSFVGDDKSKIVFAPGLCKEVMRPDSHIVSTYIKTGCPPKPPLQPECSE